MRTALIITLGTRDLFLSVENLTTYFSEKEITQFTNEKGFLIARLFGEKLLKRKIDGKLKNLISYPIVQAGLEYVIKKTERIPSHIMLIATDQKKELVGDFFWKNDTFAFAQLLQQVIPFKYKKYGSTNIKISKVITNVAYLDSMYDHFSKELNRKNWNLFKDFDKIYLLNQGGIDAINTALMLNCLNIYGNKSILLSVNERLGNCSKLDFTEQYLRENEVLKAISAIKKYRYAFIKNLNLSEDVKALASYGEHRLNFDFDEAETALLELSRKHRTYRDVLIYELNKLKANDSELLRELYANARIKFEQEAYVDFLLRLFRIIEGLTKNKVMCYLDFSFNHSKWDKDFQRFLSQSKNKPLKTHIANIILPNGQKLKVDIPSIPVLLRILEFYDNDSFKKIIKLQGLSQLRNNSIGAHNFAPVSKKFIEKELAKQRLTIKGMFEIIDSLIKPTDTYFELNRKLEEILST